jgi:hypothetical protein
LLVITETHAIQEMQMATPTAGARASRRAAARQAAAEPAPTPPAQTVTPDDLTDEAFGPDDVAAPASDSAANGTPLSGTQTPQAQTAVRPLSAQHGAIALPQVDLTREITAGDLVIPKLRISQGLSKANILYSTSRGKDGVGMGNWYNSQSGQSFGETVYFVPVDMRKSRSLFLQGQGMMCRSFDLVQGEGDPGILCEGTYEEKLTVPAEHRGCPLRLWDDKTPPKCGITYNYPGFVITADEIDQPEKAKPIQVILQLRSASTKQAKEINTIVMNDGAGVWQSVVLELGVESRSNTKGTFFVPVVDWYASTDDSEFSRIRRRADSMARSMGAATLRASLEDDGE